MKTEIKKVHVSEIKNGDTILLNGIMTTVSGKFIKKDGFMGTTLYGDCYMMGRKLVDKVIIYRAMPDGTFVEA